MKQTKPEHNGASQLIPGVRQTWRCETSAFDGQYNEEAYLFNVVGPRFRGRGQLDAYGFFSIVRWKANRAISKIASRVMEVGGRDLEKAVGDLGRDVFRAEDARERFFVLSKKWHMRLPMASAVLTVLYPDEFTVYDTRVCGILGGHQGVSGRQNVEARWNGYLEFKAAVERASPAGLSLRDKDRYLWARSRHNDLVEAIARRFRRRK
jgi:hypothetical protein